MRPAALRQVLGLAAGAALVAAGGAELAITSGNADNAAVQKYCGLGLCPEQFSVERVFTNSQKATLGDPKGQLSDAERGVEMSPASAYRWADLGEAAFNVRDLKLGEYAFSQALAAGPHSSVIQMRAANYYFQIGNSARVVELLSKLLNDRSSQEYYDTAFLTYSRLGLPIDEILNGGIPQRKEVVSSLLTFWTRIHRADEAIATWRWANQRSLVDERSTGAFFTFLDRNGEQFRGQELWQQLVAKRQPDYRKGNWIYNPRFEFPITDSPFDWTTETRKDVDTGVVSDAESNGKPAYRIRFNGESNTDYHQAYQDMVLEPGRYEFSVMVKTEQVTTDEGIRLHIYSPVYSKLDVLTDTLVGTHGWTEITKSFEVAEGAKPMRVAIARIPSNKFDNKIGGTTWLTNFKLSRE